MVVRGKLCKAFCRSPLSQEAFMRQSGKRVRRGPKGSARRGRAVVQDDRHDAMALEFLRLWMGLARLREGFPEGTGRTPPRIPPASKASRRKAA